MEWCNWKENTENTLGHGGFNKHIVDHKAVKDDPQAATNVFHCLKSALADGPAIGHAKKLEEAKNVCPIALWKSLTMHCNTETNKSNIIVWELEQLIQLTLAPDADLNNFIFNHQECLQKLRKGSSKAVDDHQIIHAFLSVVLQDDNFNSVCSDIIRLQGRHQKNTLP